ncbi:hypothetical protein [Methylobacterium isbiliense]|jgi:hypothetical protein|uniref:Nucleotide exchange factor GrpE n=1 Tax=Methylobacterium isbiliense TaxID=315478 RepID=A0ABQ4SRP9_9HYPH|nr:hypothetical protein [Methylobacterium isbiliense]MDN3624382.1 hypothetical protein [Methylobacterium isbiliense]GJE04356.1 hypothetical protein GMJLKIPL_6317 [Methylobacterium isbiliense]
MPEIKTTQTPPAASQADESDIAAPRLTPQGRTDPDARGEDATDPAGGAKQGQTDKAEG